MYVTTRALSSTLLGFFKDDLVTESGMKGFVVEETTMLRPRSQPSPAYVPLHCARLYSLHSNAPVHR